MTTMPTPTLSPVGTAPDALRSKLWKQSQEFETVFVETMLQQLTSTLSGEGPLGGEGVGGDIYRGMLTQQYARSVTASGGVGVAQDVFRELVRLQEGRRGA